jgi:hypothetical protein
MEPDNEFITKFMGLMEVRRELSLKQWQYVYKQVVYYMGQSILEKFPQDVLGPNPFDGRGGGGGGEGAGGGAGVGVGVGAGGQPVGGTTTSPTKGKHPEQDGGGPGPGAGGHPYAIVVCVLNGVLQLVPASDSE